MKESTNSVIMQFFLFSFVTQEADTNQHVSAGDK